VTTYEESAYSEGYVNEAVKTAGFPDFKACVAQLSTEGYNLTQIAEKLSLNPQRFWSYYQRWCRANVEPLRLSEDADE